MTKISALLATCFAAFGLSVFATTASAALHPLDLPLAPTPVTATPAVTLTLDPPPRIAATNPATFKATTDFLVGKDIRIALAPLANVNWRFRPSLDQRDEWEFLRRQTAGPSAFERLVDRFDVDEVDEPWATTTTVRMLAATKGWFVPFASFAHEQDINEDFDRFGIGAGAMIILGKNATFGAELMYFAGDSSTTNDAFGNETLFLTRLQLEF